MNRKITSCDGDLKTASDENHIFDLVSISISCFLCTTTHAVTRIKSIDTLAEDFCFHFAVHQ